ncbi:MAG: MarR family winged helix-turn-helix transcriptional regulator [Pseudomonadota bacterium]
MTSSYYETIQMIERLHRYFLDVVKMELDRKAVEDINNVQAMILYNIGHDTMTVGELTHRGYYLGSNVSYNVKKMSENGYIEQERSVHDKRSIRVKLTEKGEKLYDILNAMFSRHEGRLDGTKLTPEVLQETVNTLQMVERFWNAQTQFAAMEDD